MRLINASRAIARVEEIPLLTDKNQSFYEGCRYMQKRVLRIFHTSKTIDAVPVVRCKDCKHFDEYFSKCYLFCDNEIEVQLEVESDHYCSYGERKDGENHD